MIKKIYFGMILAAGMLASACTSEDEKFNIAPEDAAQVTFTVGLQDGIATRAISDGTGVNKLVYAVYDANGDQLDLIEGTDGNGQFVKENAFAAGLSDNVSITLAKGQEYTILFWAQNSNCTAYRTTNLQKVGIDYTANNNDETRDAFCAKKTFTVSGDATEQVTLKRPFAQINVGVTEADWNAAVNSGIEIEKSKVVIKQAASTMNIMTGAAIDLVDVTYELAEIPTEDLTVNGQNYKYLSMSYILANDETDGTQKATLDEIEFTFAPIAGEEIVFSEGLNNVPVQRNYRTNIIGKILTGDVDFEITIDPAFGDDHIIDLGWEKVEGTDEAGVYTNADRSAFKLTNKNALVWLADEVNSGNSMEGVTVLLESDIIINDNNQSTGVKEQITPIGTWGSGFSGTFDGQGHTIDGLYIQTDMSQSVYGYFALFGCVDGGTVKNVTLKNFECVNYGGYASAIAATSNGDCLFEDITLESGTISAYNRGTGGIVSWAGNGVNTFRNINVGSKVTIDGLWASWDCGLGGIVGQLKGSGAIFDGVTVACRIDAYNDVTSSYKWYAYRYSGMLVGMLNNSQVINGTTYPDPAASGIVCTNVTVNYGDWMNYHYCEGYGQRNWARVESGYSYGGLEAGHAHEDGQEHELCLPFNQLFGGGQGVYGLAAYEGVTVNYPASYNP